MSSILSTENILRELAYISDHTTDIDEFLDHADALLEGMDMDLEADQLKYDKVTKRLKLDILDVEKYVKVNGWKCVSNPRAFASNGIPSPDGLLSNEIFGYTARERSGTFAYIDLHGWFLNPACYKTWIRLDPAVKNIVHGAKSYIINEKGQFIEDEVKGQTGIEFLRKNIKRVKFKDTGAESKAISIKFLEQNRDKMFISKYMVIPPFYRDKNTTSSSGKAIGLGGINKIYNNLIVATNALTSTQEYGFDASEEMKGRVQDIILTIYDWFCGNRNPNVGADAGQGLSGKLGIMRRTNTSKTSNFSTRLVISAAELKSNKPEDRMVTFDKCAVPLYAVITQFRDFVMYHSRLFFENEFIGAQTYPVVTKDGQEKAIVPQDPQIIFSDERIKEEMDRFLHGYNNRFVPIEVPVEDSKEVFYMKFKGRDKSVTDLDHSNPLCNRRLTWCDVFYMASVEAVKDKHVLITRFPIDYFSNQFTCGVVVSSTKETEEVNFNGTYYKYYPKIREKDIERDTSNKFVDTLVFSNLYLSGIGGDYDGDQCTCKGVYTREANEELENYMNSKANFITFSCTPLRQPGADTYNAIYSLTKILSDTKVTSSSSIVYK